MKTYKLAVLGLVHDHIWGILDEFLATGRVEFVAVSDPNPELLQRFTAKFGGIPTFASYQDLLDKVPADIATIYVENSRGHEIVKACAAKGIGVISEKPMAARLWQADEMLKAAGDSGITLMINWPSAWDPCLAKAISMATSGEIGQVYKIRNVSSHGGPKEIGCDRHFWEWLHDGELNGAGALMDYCCYGAALCGLVLGEPEKVTGIRGTYVKDYLEVDDNAVILAGYGSAIGIMEASWTEATHLYTQQFFGTKGDIFCQDGTLTLVSAEGSRKVDVPPLPAHKANGPAYFVHCLDTGEKVQGLCDPQVSRIGQEILEAGKRSADSGVAVQLPIGE